MSSLHDHLVDYLRVRRALGFKLERTEYELRQFVGWLEARGTDTITVENALSWATRSPRATVSHPKLLRMIRGFVAYLRSLGVPVEVPASDLLPDRRCRAIPFLYTDEEIAALRDAAGTLSPAHRAATMRTLIGLLAVTGMRRGEALALDREDFDPAAGVLIVRHGKFDKSRELPLHRTSVEAISEYLGRPDRPRPADPKDTALLLGDHGRRLSLSPSQHGPRWDPWSEHPYHPHIQHSDPSHTYWYLEAAPELMALAGERLERHLEVGR